MAGSAIQLGKGQASTASTLLTARTINGVSFNGSANITTPATSFTLNSLGTATMNISAGSTGVYRNENGLGGNYSYAPVLHVAASDTMWQINVNHGTGNGTMTFRQGYNGSWGSWLTVLSSANYQTYAQPVLTQGTNIKTINGNSILGSGDLVIATQGGVSPDAISSISTNTTAVPYTTYVCTASLTLTLPAQPTVGVWVVIVNRSSVATVVVARNGQNIMSLAEDMTLNTLINGPGLKLSYVSATHGWVIV